MKAKASAILDQSLTEKVIATHQFDCNQTPLEFEIPIRDLVRFVHETWECRYLALQSENKRLKEELAKVKLK